MQVKENVTEEVPLIWTTKGNVPVSSLEYYIGWDISEEAIVFKEQYRLNGEIVKENAHVKLLKGEDNATETAQFQ
jgi:hypothetical protein